MGKRLVDAEPTELQDERREFYAMTGAKETEILDANSFNKIAKKNLTIPDGVKKTALLISKTKHQANTVLYPASGIDSDGAVTLFPDAQDYIGMDARPFYVSGKKAIKPVKETLSDQNWNAWEEIDQVTSENGAFIALCERLRNSGFRIRKVIAFFENRKRPPERRVVDGLPICNGLIEFDKGDGTSIKRYWHIDFRNEYNVVNNSPEGAAKLFQILDAHPPDTVLIKGAMGSLRTRDFRRGDLPAYIEKWLQQRHGILVEGFNTNGEGEFYFRKERSETIHDITLSYGPGVRIITFH